MPTPLPRPAHALALVVLLISGGLATGCSNTVEVGRSHVLQVALTEYHVRPQSVRAPAGTLSIYVHNYGRLSHNLVIIEGSRVQATTEPIQPGQTAELVANLAPGKYLLASTVLSDQALGLYGTLTVAGG
jgi:hypothetical protein